VTRECPVNSYQTYQRKKQHCVRPSTASPRITPQLGKSSRSQALISRHLSSQLKWLDAPCVRTSQVRRLPTSRTMHQRTRLMQLLTLTIDLSGCRTGIPSPAPTYSTGLSTSSYANGALDANQCFAQNRRCPAPFLPRSAISRPHWLPHELVRDASLEHLRGGYRRCPPYNWHFAAIDDAGSVLTGAGMCSEHPLHQITKSWRLWATGNMRDGVGEQKKNVKARGIFTNAKDLACNLR
jgi:hypothetical protein